MSGIRTGAGGTGGIQGITEAFSWDNFANLIRWDATRSNNMIVRTAASFTSGKYLQIDSAAFTAYDFSMCCWFKTSNAGTQTLMWVGDKDVSDRYQELTVSGTAVSATSRDSAGTATAANTAIDPDDGAWHFAAATFAVANRHAYADTNATSDITSIPITATYDRTTLGRFAGSTPTANFVGEMDAAMIFSKKLSGAEVAWIEANKPTLEDLQTSGDADNPGTDDLVAYWTLNEQDGQTREDSFGSFDLADTGNVLADDGTVLFPANVGESVWQITDLSGQDDHFTQDTYGLRGIVISVADGPGLALRLDGVDDYYQTPAFSPTWAVPNDFFICQQVVSVTGNNTFWDGQGATNRQWFYMDTNFWRGYAGSFVNFWSTIVSPATNLYVMGMRLSATDFVGYKGDGVPNQGGGAGTQALNGLTLGAQYNGGANFNNFDFRTMAANNGLLSDDDFNTIARQLANNNGLSWTDITPP